MISLILEGVKTIFGWVKEKSQAKHERNLAQIKNEANWSMAQITNKDKFIRIGAFLLYASPLIANWISPELGATVQQGWNQLTPDQAEALKVICFAVFGIRTGTRFIRETLGIIKETLNK